MEWSTESIEKVIRFVQERPFLFDVSSAELAWTCTKISCKKLVQVSWLCVTTIRLTLQLYTAGLVVYTGRETKVMLNSTSAPRKRSSVERTVNRQVGLHQLAYVHACSVQVQLTAVESERKQTVFAWLIVIVPRRSRHSSHWSCIATLATFHQPTPAHCASLSTQHVRPSPGFSGCWSDGLKLSAARWTQRSGMWCRQLQTVL